jgi:hypothetical protein
VFLSESDGAGSLPLGFRADVKICIVPDTRAHAGQCILQCFQCLNALPILDFLFSQLTALFHEPVMVARRICTGCRDNLLAGHR